MNKQNKTYLEIEVDETALNQAEAIFTQLGTDIETAINVFLRHTVLNRGFPFDLTKIPYRRDDTMISNEVLIEQSLRELEEKHPQSD